MTRLPRLNAGNALAAIGVLHTAIGLAEYRRTLREMARDEVVGAVNGDHERGEAFWFLVCGVSMVLTGRLARWTQLRTGALPTSTGSMLLGIGAAGATLMPRSGFWTLSVPAILALEARRRGSDDGAASSGTSDSGRSVAVPNASIHHRQPVSPKPDGVRGEFLREEKTLCQPTTRTRAG